MLTYVCSSSSFLIQVFVLFPPPMKTLQRFFLILKIEKNSIDFTEIEMNLQFDNVTPHT